MVNIQLSEFKKLPELINLTIDVDIDVKDNRVIALKYLYSVKTAIENIIDDYIDSLDD